MKTYAFTIYGNQENKNGNPIPYFRSTQGSFFNKGSRRYQAWKDYVRKAFFDSVKTTMSPQDYNLLNIVAMKYGQGKPIVLERGYVAEMIMSIFWANGAHADGDNIFKGIADALFANDKNIWHGVFFALPAGDKKGRVEVSIKIDGEK